MPLTSHQRQFLKGQAHDLNPVVLLGSDGLTEGVIKEIDSSIEHHELIKIRVNAELVQVVGRVAVLFRQKKEGSRFILPRA